jgi:2-dehydropantoate 2-reductase
VGVDRTTTLCPRFITAEQIEGAFDLVLVAVKAAALDSALTGMETAIGEHTAILPFLNRYRPRG